MGEGRNTKSKATKDRRVGQRRSNARVVRELDLIRVRLTESSERTSSEVERLYGESDLRFHIAAPLLVLAITFVAEIATGLPWNWSIFSLAMLLVPALVVAQGGLIRRRANTQLVDALRARQGTPELERLTPIFKVYRDRADTAAAAIRNAAEGGRSGG